MFIQNEYFSITHTGQSLFIEVMKPGFSIRDFQIILEKYPEITITRFLALKKALESCCSEKTEFGILKPRVELFILPDAMEAKVNINLGKEMYKGVRGEVREEILKLLQENQVVHGILYDVINKMSEPGKNIVVAKGSLPKKGENAQIIYLEVSESKPMLRDDGRTNYYDMNLFKHVHKGDWLGEKTFATSGIDGKNIKGDILPGKAGRDQVLQYDHKTVEQIEKEDKIVLVAKCDGALQIKQGKIEVMDHLVIERNVGTETGNIEFDGYVTIKGTVEDGFSVLAKNDISILSPMGVGAAERICSKLGNVYISGGVSGKSKCIVEAGISVFVKYANMCSIRAEDTIDIGYYALDSQLEADNILVQAKNGRTIGGTIRAKSKVSLRMVGNVYEKETYINVEGFDRKEVKKQLDELLMEYKVLLIQVEQNERELKVYETTINQLEDVKANEDYMGYQKKNEELVSQIYKLEEKRKALLKTLSSKGEGEVTIYEKAYPRTFLQIKNLQKRLQAVTTGTFYAQDNELKFD